MYSNYTSKQAPPSSRKLQSPPPVSGVGPQQLQPSIMSRNDTGPGLQHPPSPLSSSFNGEIPPSGIGIGAGWGNNVTMPDSHCSGNATGESGTSVPNASSFINWATAAGNIVKDIRNMDFDDILLTNWSNPMTVTSHAHQRKLPIDSDIFTRAHTDLPWKDQGNIVFICKGGKYVRVHAVLLNAIVPDFVNELMELQRFLYIQSDCIPNLPVYVKGVDPRCIEQFLVLLNRGKNFMTGREIMQLKKLVEILHIAEINIFVTYVGGLNQNAGSCGGTTGVNIPAPVSTAVHSGARIPSTVNSGHVILGNPPTPPSSPPATLAIRSRINQLLNEPQEIDSFEDRNTESANTKTTGLSTLDIPRNDSDVVEEVDGISKFHHVIANMNQRSAFDMLPASATIQERKDEETVSHVQIEVPAPMEKKRRSNRMKLSTIKNQADTLANTCFDENDDNEAKRKRTVYAKGLRQNVLAALKDGATIEDVAERFRVDAKVICRWKFRRNRNDTATGTIEKTKRDIATDNEMVVAVSSMEVEPVNDAPEVSSPTIRIQQHDAEPNVQLPEIGFHSVLLKDDSADLNCYRDNATLFTHLNPVCNPQVMTMETMNVVIQDFVHPQQNRDTVDGGSNQLTLLPSSSASCSTSTVLAIPKPRIPRFARPVVENAPPPELIFLSDSDGENPVSSLPSSDQIKMDFASTQGIDDDIKESSSDDDSTLAIESTLKILRSLKEDMTLNYVVDSDDIGEPVKKRRKAPVFAVGSSHMITFDHPEGELLEILEEPVGVLTHPEEGNSSNCTTDESIAFPD